jgi:hypothetical protein
MRLRSADQAAREGLPTRAAKSAQSRIDATTKSTSQSPSPAWIVPDTVASGYVVAVFGAPRSAFSSTSAISTSTTIQ